MQSSKSFNLTLVPVITLIIGFISFLLLSIYYKVFWFNSKYDIPLIYNVSVMLGDAILLPTINYKIFNLLLNYLGIEVIKKNTRKLLIWLAVATTISLLTNISTHLYWVNDQYTDFVGFRQGEFSIIGYWHLIYSILQMLLLLMFPFLWLIAIKEKKINGIKYSHNIWKFVLIFSTLAIFDMLNKYFFIYRNNTILYAMQVDKFAFMTTILSLSLYFVMRYIEKNVK